MRICLYDAVKGLQAFSPSEEWMVNGRDLKNFLERDLTISPEGIQGALDLCVVLFT
jgi:hypothetical protein